MFYSTRGECSLQADVYPAEAEGPRPAVIWLHGGGLIFGSRSTITPSQVAMYTGAGLTVIAADYRLAPETTLPEIVGDVVALGAWARARADELHVKADRISIVGHSAGGYLALMGGALLEPRPRALVSFYGYGDILGDWYVEPSRHYCQQPPVTEVDAWQAVGSIPVVDDRMMSRWPFYLYCRQQGLWTTLVSGCDPHVDGALLARYCPERQVTGSYPPTLLLHGDEDTDVPYAKSVAMRMALDAAGVENRLITIPGGGHGFESEQEERPDVQAAMGDVVRFLAQHLGE